MFIKYSIFICYITILWCGRIDCVSMAPCHNVYIYDENETNFIHGYIELKIGSNIPIVTLDVEISSSSNDVSSFNGKLNVLLNRKQIKNVYENGGKLTYSIHMPKSNVIPTLTSIKLNKKEYCKGKRLYDENGNFRYSKHLIHQIRIENDGSIKFIRNLKNHSNSDKHHILRRKSRQAFRGNQQNCGRSTTNALVYGDKVQPGKWPWLTAIYENDGFSASFLCAGSIISNKAMLTAAHCFSFSRDPEDYLLRMGAHNINDWTNGDVITIKPDEIYVHEEYSESLYDIALLIFERIDFSKNIQPVCLWRKHSELQLILNKTGYVAGWGFSNKKKLSEEPNEVDLVVVPPSDCKKLEANLRTGFCAGNNHGKGLCNGDSGGGFYLYEENRWIIRGITSTATRNEYNECDFQHVAFTDIALVLKWIDRHLQ